MYAYDIIILCSGTNKRLLKGDRCLPLFETVDYINTQMRGHVIAHMEQSGAPISVSKSTMADTHSRPIKKTWIRAFIDMLAQDAKKVIKSNNGIKAITTRSHN